MRILIVDDEQTALRSVSRILRRRGIRNLQTCDNGREAINRIKETDFDIVLLDLIMPEVDGLKILESVKPSRPHTEFILLTAMDDVSNAVQAIRLGAYDYLVKPVENNRLFLSIERAYERKGLLAGLSGGVSAPGKEPTEAFSSIITANPRMKELLAYAHIMARSGNPVLVTGESGTGKELLANGVHSAGPHPEGPFVAVNIASVPESLFDGEFFGHVKGAFTGAEQEHPGYIERANGGTLFLDEIGELPMNLQSKLLRVLEEKSVTKLGGSKSVQVSLRIVSATNKDLDQACKEGRFRLDLLYRLKAAHVHLPPLRERRDDISVLASHFLEKAAVRHDKADIRFSPEAMEVLIHKDYLGNIRELAQLVERALLLCDSNLILPRHLGEEHSPHTLSIRSLCTLKENDESHLAFILNHTKGDLKQAAGILGVTVRQVQRKLVQMKDDPKWATFIQ